MQAIAGWRREFVRSAARLRNGLRLQADRRAAQMHPARGANASIRDSAITS